MNRRGLKNMMLGGVVAALSLIAGCQSTESAGTAPAASAPAAAPTPAPRTTTRGVYRPDVPAGYTATALSFPTGDPQTSAVMLHQVMPNRVTRGSEFNFEVHVTNLTTNDLEGVAVTLESISNLNVVSSTPAPAAGSGGGVATWAVGKLNPGQTQVIRGVASAPQLAQAGACMSVAYNSLLCATTEVVEPALQLVKTATPSALLCDPIELVYTVANPGSGVASNVVITDTLADCIAAGDSNTRNVKIDVGDLAPGERKAFRVIAKATCVGEHCSAAVATADNGLRAEAASVCTVVTAPKLEIAANCRDDQYISRGFTHSYTVRNTGNGPSANTVVTVALPAGATVTGTSQGGAVSGGTASFNLGTLAPGAEATVTVDLTTDRGGAYTTRAVATGSCATQVDANCTTSTRGIPAILLEVVDLDDPVEVGQQTVYVITVTNQGSAPDTNVVVEVTLPEEQQLVTAGGATNGDVSGRTIRFAPLPRLEAKAKAEWRITINAIGEADVRFAVQLTSDQFQNPIRETESTNLYR